MEVRFIEYKKRQMVVGRTYRRLEKGEGESKFSSDFYFVQIDPKTKDRHYYRSPSGNISSGYRTNVRESDIFMEYTILGLQGEMTPELKRKRELEALKEPTSGSYRQDKNAAIRNAKRILKFKLANEREKSMANRYLNGVQDGHSMTDLGHSIQTVTRSLSRRFKEF